MLGLRITGRGSELALPAFMREATLAIDFKANTAWTQDGSASPSHLVSMTRSSTSHASDPSGMVQSFPADVARITAGGLTLLGDVTRLHGEAPIVGGKIGASAVSALLSPQAPFTPRHLSSGGANWHQWRVPCGAIVQDEPRFFRARYRAGTSGRCFVGFTIQGSSSDTYADLNGPVGALGVANTSGGSMADVEQHYFGDGVHEVKGRLIPGTSADGAAFGVGPHSNVAGEDITILGMQVTDQYADWIMEGTDAVSKEGDGSLIDLSSFNLQDGFMLRLRGHLPTIDNDHSYARLYQASDGTRFNRFFSFLNKGTATVNLEHHDGGAVQNGYPTLAQPLMSGAFDLVAGHGPDFIGGAWNGALITPITSAAAYTPPTQIALGRDDLSWSIQAAMIVESFALYGETPTWDRLSRILSYP
ncbi:MAG: hypothetical protein AAF590_03745 [Pseudomonadota bacterium]